MTIKCIKKENSSNEEINPKKLNIEGPGIQNTPAKN
jgi:hypothetical protein